MARKNIVETAEVRAFAERMSPLSRRKYDRALFGLREFGYLRMPEAEKVDGYDNLFAIRIMTDGNERFFYAYDDGVNVYVLHAYEKRTPKIPQSEINHALQIKKELLGGAL